MKNLYIRSASQVITKKAQDFAHLVGGAPPAAAPGSGGGTTAPASSGTIDQNRVKELSDAITAFVMGIPNLRAMHTQKIQGLNALIPYSNKLRAYLPKLPKLTVEQGQALGDILLNANQLVQRMSQESQADNSEVMRLSGEITRLMPQVEQILGKVGPAPAAAPASGTAAPAAAAPGTTAPGTTAPATAPGTTAPAKPKYQNPKGWAGQLAGGVGRGLNWIGQQIGDVGQQFSQGVKGVQPPKRRQKRPPAAAPAAATPPAVAAKSSRPVLTAYMGSSEHLIKGLKLVS